MPKPKYVKRKYQKTFKTYNNIVLAVHETNDKAKQKEIIKSSNSGSDTFTLIDKHIDEILKHYDYGR